MVSPWRSAFVLLRASFRAAVQYRLNFVSTIVGGIFYQGTQLLFIGVLLARFGVVHGWGLPEVGLVFSIRLAAHACFVVPFGALVGIDQYIQQGDVDRVLVRPANIWIQLVFKRFPLMAVGDLLLGTAALVIFCVAAPVDWTLLKAGFLLCAVIGGGLVETGIQTFLSGLSFPLVSSLSVRLMADDIMTRFSGYPLTMFGRWGLYSLTFVFPMAFIAFLPAAVLLGRLDEIPLPAWLAYASPLAGPVVFLLGYHFFMRMTRHYSSPGN